MKLKRQVFAARDQGAFGAAQSCFAQLHFVVGAPCVVHEFAHPDGGGDDGSRSAIVGFLPPESAIDRHLDVSARLGDVDFGAGSFDRFAQFPDTGVGLKSRSDRLFHGLGPCALATEHASHAQGHDGRHAAACRRGPSQCRTDFEARKYQ